ncbi:hypothetical protein QJQ45_010986 [Haematococcus lacustris]|nr:hypothetical protein QJQ45_010986 [Haematococcus lacustris]
MAAEGQRSVIVPLLTEANSEEWFVRQQAYLVVHDLWDVVEDGVETVSEEGSSTITDASAKARKDAKAKAIISLALSTQFLKLAKESRTAGELWKRLLELFKRSAAASRIQLVMEMADLSKEPTESMLQYVGRAEALAGKIELTGKPFPDVLSFVLKGLSPEYKHVVTQIKFMEEPTLQKVMPHLLTCEVEIDKGGGQGWLNGSVMSMHPGHGGRSGKGVTSGGAGSGGGNAGGGFGRAKVCWTCGEEGYLAKDCPKRKGREGGAVSCSQESVESAKFSNALW